MSRERAAAAAPLDGLYRLGGELIALAYIAIIAEIACATGAVYVLFPELGALSHDVMTRPRGTWANAPLLLAITPVMTGVVGIVFTRSLPYGYLSVLLTVGGAIAVVLALRSPVAPAISAGLLPLVLGVKSWRYPPAIALGTVLLATLCVPWKKYCATRMVAAAPAESDKARENLHNDLLDDLIEMPPSGYGWLVVLMAFVAFAMFFVKLTGLRFVLFPPLVVIGFEMLGHTAICPWADKPMRLPLRVLSHGARRIHIVALSRGDAAGRGLQHGVGNRRAAHVRPPRAACAGRRLAAAGDGQADDRLSVRGRDRHYVAVALVPRLSAAFARGAQYPLGIPSSRSAMMLR